VQVVSGLVRQASGQPLAGATVRIRASQHSTHTDSQGRFTLVGFDPTFRLRITGWADGHYVGGRTVWPWNREIVLVLDSYTVADDSSYDWIAPAVDDRTLWEDVKVRARLDPTGALAPDTLFFKAAEGLRLGCRDCHGEVIYDQWAASAHALGFSNARFASMYNGTDLSGVRRSPSTRYGYDRDYGRFPLRPDPSQPYYGPGYLLDFPATAGNCATCHLPGASLAAPYGVTPDTVDGVDALGAHCDFCHKISDVRLSPDTGLPYENMPGTLSLVMMRPAPDRQLFFGPYDDVDAGVDTYLPLLSESRYCAPCHQASFWGTPVYESFAEWLASPYSDPETGRTCQDCHMQPDGVTTNFAPGRAGQERDPQTIPTHSFPGAADQSLLGSAVTMTVTARPAESRLVVDVTITNDGTGHHVPTDSPLRQLILLVRALDGGGRELELLEGPRVPDWGGVGDPTAGNFAGRAGRIYAKVLQELWTDVAPTGAYWNPTRILSDTRLPAMGQDRSTYAFVAPLQGSARVMVTLYFRRAFKQLSDQKGWLVPDVVMEEQVVQVP
jgi:hypothetical protein